MQQGGSKEYAGGILMLFSTEGIEKFDFFKTKTVSIEQFEA